MGMVAIHGIDQGGMQAAFAPVLLDSVDEWMWAVACIKRRH